MPNSSWFTIFYRQQRIERFRSIVWDLKEFMHWKSNTTSKIREYDISCFSLDSESLVWVMQIRAWRVVSSQNPPKTKESVKNCVYLNVALFTIGYDICTMPGYISLAFIKVSPNCLQLTGNKRANVQIHLISVTSPTASLYQRAAAWNSTRIEPNRRISFPSIPLLC